LTKQNNSLLIIPDSTVVQKSEKYALRHGRITMRLSRWIGGIAVLGLMAAALPDAGATSVLPGTGTGTDANGTVVINTATVAQTAGPVGLTVSNFTATATLSSTAGGVEHDFQTWFYVDLTNVVSAGTYTLTIAPSTLTMSTNPSLHSPLETEVSLNLLAFFTGTAGGRSTPNNNGPGTGLTQLLATNGVTTLNLSGASGPTTAGSGLRVLELLATYEWFSPEDPPIPMTPGAVLTIDPPQFIVTLDDATVPEPSTVAMALMAAGGVGFVGWRKRRAG
jgi:PEP-CTERM motif